MSTALTVECEVHFHRLEGSRKELREGAVPTPPPVPAGQVPRVARLMALALRFDRLVRSGAVRDQADLVRLGHVTRARVSQIMSLLNLAPDIQESILFLLRTERGRAPLILRQLLPAAAVPDWARQRRMWAALRANERR